VPLEAAHIGHVEAVFAADESDAAILSAAV
jgi:hypothetical protein